MTEFFVQSIIKKLIERSMHIVFAESCTAGLVSDAIVQIPGASQVFWGSFITYSTDAKVKSLGIDPQLIERFGAVSEECALAMARGAREKSGADLAVSVTGLAGPEGDGSSVPVGTVWIALEGKDLPPRAVRYQFSGSRSEIRELATDRVIKKLADVLETA